MTNPVGGPMPPTGGPSGQPEQQQPDKFSERAKTFFKDMPMTKKQFEQFMRSLDQFLSIQIKSEQQEMMKQLKKLGPGGDEQ
ncbi:MAG: hypothetical protein Tsb0015_16670 [Simkaniaceae bacterium]